MALRYRSFRKRRPRPLGLAAACILLLAAAAGAASWARTDEPRSDLTLLTAPVLALTDPRRALLLHGGQWLNGRPLTEADLKGKVVLVNFWTYSCINSLRPLPYLRAWAKKYADRGLVVVGVHTPEFGFEKDAGNVRRALAQQGIGYHVVLDNHFDVWSAFGNDAWPAFYFIGADGRVRRRIAGEGRYEDSEKVIQALLSEARGAPVNDPIAPVVGAGAQAAPDWANIGSDETYVGYAKAEGFAQDSGLRPDRATLYRPPARLGRNQWSLAGPWNVGGEYATLTGDAGQITYRFHARDLNLVMAPPNGRSMWFTIKIDGAAPGSDHGADTDVDGWGRLDRPRMYQLVRQSRPVADRTVEISFYGAGVRAYVFTFG